MLLKAFQLKHSPLATFPRVLAAAPCNALAASRSLLGLPCSLRASVVACLRPPPALLKSRISRFQVGLFTQPVADWTRNKRSTALRAGFFLGRSGITVEQFCVKTQGGETVGRRACQTFYKPLRKFDFIFPSSVTLTR